VKTKGSRVLRIHKPATSPALVTDRTKSASDLAAAAPRLFLFRP